MSSALESPGAPASGTHRQPAWGLRFLWWAAPLPLGPSPRIHVVALNRLLGLSSLLLAVLGLLLALDAPRTLDRLLALLWGLEAFVLAAAGIAWCVVWLRTLPTRLSRAAAEQPDLQRRLWGGVLASTRVAPPMLVDWRCVEASLLWLTLLSACCAP